MKRLALSILVVLLAAAPLAGHTATRTVHLAVENMTCAACPITVKKALERVPGVARVEVSYERKEAVVTYDEERTTVEALIEATTKAGYPARRRSP
jgi:mercuric ion binding protein